MISPNGYWRRTMSLKTTTNPSITPMASAIPSYGGFGLGHVSNAPWRRWRNRRYSSTSHALATRNPTPSSSNTAVSNRCTFTGSSDGFDWSRGQAWIETVTAPRLVQTARANQHPVAAVDQTLRMVRRLATHDTDRQRLGDVLGNRQQLRHRVERAAEIILIQTRHDQAPPPVRQRVAHHRQAGIEELSLVDANDVRIVVDAGGEVVGTAHVL